MKKYLVLLFVLATAAAHGATDNEKYIDKADDLQGEVESNQLAADEVIDETNYIDRDGKSLQKTTKSLEANVDRIQKRMVNRKEVLQKKRAQLAQIDKRAREISIENKKWEGRKAELERKITGLDTQVSALNKRVEGATVEKRQLRLDISKEEGREAQLIKREKFLRAQIERDRTKTHDLQAHKSRQVQINHKLEDRIKHLRPSSEENSNADLNLSRNN